MHIILNKRFFINFTFSSYFLSVDWLFNGCLSYDVISGKWAWMRLPSVETTKLVIARVIRYTGFSSVSEFFKCIKVTLFEQLYCNFNHVNEGHARMYQIACKGYKILRFVLILCGVVGLGLHQTDGGVMSFPPGNVMKTTCRLSYVPYCFFRIIILRVFCCCKFFSDNFLKSYIVRALNLDHHFKFDP